jgi:hypothetical protein
LPDISCPVNRVNDAVVVTIPFTVPDIPAFDVNVNGVPCGNILLEGVVIGGGDSIPVAVAIAPVESVTVNETVTFGPG